MFLFLHSAVLSSCYHLCTHILHEAETNHRLIVQHDREVMNRLDELLSFFSPVPSPPAPPHPPDLPTRPPWPLHPPEPPVFPPVVLEEVQWWVYVLGIVGGILLCFTHPLTLLCCLHERRNLF
jgi:hypothetical protein